MEHNAPFKYMCIVNAPPRISTVQASSDFQKGRRYTSLTGVFHSIIVKALHGIMLILVVYKI